jgi:tripeptide aminopeptidase
MLQPSVADVLSLSEAYLEPIVALTTRLTQVSAPTNDEGARAAELKTVFEEQGYANIAVDALNDVTARIPGKDRSRTLLIAAHTDTVFPHGTDLTVRREGDVLHAPGVGDNTVAVAAVTFLKKAFSDLGVVPAMDIVVTGNVGEEGLGDLRGMRAVVDGLPDIAGAIAVEGHLLGRLTHRAVGSKRLQVTVTGPGGHSWGRAGEPSAIHHLARIIARLDDIPLQDQPKTSFNAGIFNGGISVNTIAPEAVAVLDMRSTSADALADLMAEVERIIGMPTPAGISVRTDVVGDRPAGENPRNEGLAPIADAVLRELGFDVHYDASSTDANVPISRGIPAICIGLTTGANAHRTDEFIRISPLVKGFAQLVLTTLRSATALAR